MLAVFQDTQSRSFATLPGWTRMLVVGSLILTGIAAMLALHAPAHAQETDETSEESIEHIAVPFTKADLSDAPHRQALLARIDHAALQACGDDFGEFPQIRAAIAQSACRHASVLAAVATLHDPEFTQEAHAMMELDTREREIPAQPQR